MLTIVVIDNIKSTSSYVFTLCGSSVNWKSQLQNIVALSTESEYIVAIVTIKKSLWFRCLLNELDNLSDNVTIYSDSQSSICVCKTLVFLWTRWTYRYSAAFY